MNKDLEQKLVAGLDEVQTWVNTTKDFVADQAPLVVQEVIRWGIAQNVFWIVIFAIVAIALIPIYRASTKGITWQYWEHDHYGTDYPIGFLIRLPFIAGWFVLFVCSNVAIYDLVFILVAPRLYVLNYLANLLNKANG